MTKPKILAKKFLKRTSEEAKVRPGRAVSEVAEAPSEVIDDFFKVDMH